VRRPARRTLGLASGGYRHGQSPVWGGDIGANPTDRAKNGTKRSLLTDGAGGPLAAVVAPANVHDTKLLKATLEAVVVERPKPTPRRPQPLCLDKAYDNPTGHATVAATDYVPHIRPIREEPPKKSQCKFPARRWVVERTLAWLSKCRAILVRYDKKSQNYLGLVQFACALRWYRRLATNQCIR
jgi:putative transposase